MTATAKNSLRLRIFTEPQQGATYADLLAVAREAETLGFDAFFRSDHWLHMGSDRAADPAAGEPGPTDAWVTLAGLARETSRIRLGTLVTSATFRHPGPLVIAVAQVDEMSGGRVELGLGAGWFEAEHAAYGVPFPDLGERFERLAEQLEVITGLWRTPSGKTFTFSGKHYRLEDSPALPKPAQPGGPPVIVGGMGKTRTPRLAARFAAEANMPFQPLDAFTEQRDRFRAACEAAGRDPATLAVTAALVVCCGTDEAEFTRRAAAIGRQPDELRTNGAAGTPAEVVEKLLAYRDAGAEAVYLQVLDLGDLDHLRLVATEVMPQVG
jgi:F420-dependent oxidoreductase-like protein